MAGVLAFAGLAPVGAQERPMLVEYLPVAAQSAGEVLGTKAHALDEIRSDSGVLALRIGHATPEPVIHARALSIVLPGTDETLTFDDLVVEALDSGYALYSRDRQSTTSTTLVVMGEDVVGTIHHDGAVYGVRPLGDGLTAVYLYDAAQLREAPENVPDFVIPHADPEEPAMPLQRAPPAMPSQRAPPAVQDSRDEIDVLVVYSESAKRVAGNIAARIALLVLHTHLAYEDSGITTRLRVVHSYETSYTPVAESDHDRKEEDLHRLRRPGDGFLDEALPKREQFAADVVMLLVRQKTGVCGGGIAYILDHSPGDAELAFGLSAIGLETCSDFDGNTFAHEIGHIQGANHNPEEFGGIPQQPYTYGHGFCNATNNWRTVMSYNTGGRCEPRIRHFSNPMVPYRGTATGDVRFRNVTRLINETATHVANFRQSKTQATTTHMLPLVTPASNLSQQGLVRIVNNSNRAGSVSITAIDDRGQRFGPVSLSLGALEAVNFASQDLESGNVTAGLSGGVGNGSGNWRLELMTDLEIEHLAYIRTPDGLLASMHEVAAETAEGPNRYHVPFFNPGGNVSRVSRLRLINPGSSSASIEITGVDDAGRTPPRGSVRLTLGAGMSRSLTARELENGTSEFSGFGAGTDKWRLSVSASQPIQVMSLLQLISGHLTNLSRGQDGVAVPPPPPPGQPDLIVESPSADPATPSAGQLFLLSATVRNQGGTQSAATQLRFYRSSDATISRSDTALQDVSVSALPPSGTSNSAISVTAPSAAGTYYYGACVDEVSGESNAANNCSDAVRVVVSGGSRSCTVTLSRSPSSGGTETVSIRLSDARQTGIGTIADPFVVRARMDDRSDVDSYRIDLRQAGDLYIASVGGLDTEAVFLADNCTEVGTVVGDLGITFPNDFDPTNYNFAVVGDLNAGTYYLVVYEWARRVGPYVLGVGVDNSSGGVGTGRLEPIEGWNSLIDRLDSDGVGGRN